MKIHRHIPGSAHKRVLIVEDHPTLRFLALKHLESFGLTSVAVGTGTQALEELVGAQFDLVLVDCHLPDIDGFSLTRIIRRKESESRGHLIIIAMTASVLPGDQDRCREAGMDDYLSKPYTTDELHGKLVHWLTDGTAESSAGS